MLDKSAVVGQAVDTNCSGARALESIVGSSDICSFLRHDWEESFRSGRGPNSGYKQLFAWQDLNNVLMQQRLSRTRLILYDQGKPIPPSEFQYSNGRDFLLKDDQFLRYLRRGATLIVNCIEEAHEPLRNLTIELRRFFRARVDINLYAAWGETQGFDRHFDTQDNFIVQLAGRKRWTIWEPTRTFPLKGDLSEAEKPNAPPVWDGDLTEGSWFYIPRGWWHVASPCGEPCMHLTVTIWSFCGIDFLTWAAERLRAIQLVRRNLPVLANGTARATYLDVLKAEMCAQLTEDNLDGFLRERVDGFHYPHLQLPSLHS